MTQAPQARRTLLVAGAVTAGAALTTGVFGLLAPLRAQGLAPTPTMRGGDNNYRPGAPIVNRIGNGGFWLARERDDADPEPDPARWPDVVAVVPARDEADVISRSIASAIDPV